MSGTLTENTLQTVGRILSDKFGIRVICQGNACKTDGKGTIYLPAIPPSIDSKELLGLVRLWLDHECGHFVGKSNTATLQEVETKHGKAARAMLNALEDCRVQNVMADIWAGCGVNFQVGGNEMLRRLAQRADAGVEVPRTPLTDAVIGTYALGSRLNKPPWISAETEEFLDRNGDEILQAIETSKSTEDLVPLALKLVEQLKVPEDQPQDGPKPQPDAQQSQKGGGSGDTEPSPEDGEGEGEDQGKSKGGSKGKSPKKSKSKDKGDDQGDGDGQAEGKDWKQLADEDAGDDQQETSTSQAGSEPARPLDEQADDADTMDIMNVTAAEIAEGMKPEGGIHHFLLPAIEGMDKWVEMPEQPPNAATKAELIDKARTAGGPIRQRLLQLLLVEEKSWWRGGMKRGAPDPRTLAKLATRIDDRVLRRRFEKLAPSTACFLLVDGSGSMEINDAIRMRTAMQAATAFASVLHAAGHPTASAMFQNGEYYPDKVLAELAKGGSIESQEEWTDRVNKEYAKGPNSPMPDSPLDVAQDQGLRIWGINMVWLKHWHENVATVMDRLALACSKASGGTPMAQAIIMAAKELAAKPAKRKVMLVFTDGDPNSRDATTEACRICEANEIEVVLIGILTSMVRELHPSERCAVVKDITKLSESTMEELRKAIRPGTGGRVRAVV